MKIDIMEYKYMVEVIAGQYPVSGALTEEDLRQEGWIGLMVATESFDEEKGVLFETYASYYVRKAILEALANNGQALRVPRNCVEELGFETFSLNEQEEGEQYLADEMQQPDEVLEKKQEREWLTKMVERLPLAQQQVLRYSYGLNDTEEMTVEEVAKKLDTTVDSVYKTQEMAIARMRRRAHRRR